MKNASEISHDQVEFTRCRVFAAERTIDFNAPYAKQAHFGAVSLDDTLRRLPGGLQVNVKPRSRISSDMVVGTLIDGVVAGDVKEKHAVVIPAGARAHPRYGALNRPIRLFCGGIEFTEVEVQGIRHIFCADLVDIDPAPRVEAITASTRGIKWPFLAP